MDVLKIFFLSLGSLVVLFILTKLMGNREMSQLSIFDYIISITIGSIAAEMSTSLENNFMEPLVAMVVYAGATIIISFITSHSLKLRELLTGKSLILFDNGKLYRENFKKAKLDLNEFLMQCRTNGYFSLSDLQTAVLEANGKISFLPNSLKRPATPEDLNLNPKQDYLKTNLILDGAVLEDNLKFTGHDKEWLQKQIKKQGIYDFKQIFLATYDSNNDLSIYVKLV